MPTIDVEYAEFEKLLGVKFHGDMDRLGEVLALAKGEVKTYDERTGVMSVELKDTNRPDLWNVEGLARTLRLLTGLEKGLKQYKAGKYLIEVCVDPRLKPIRPYIACSIVKDLMLTDAVIRGMMQLQDKLDHTYGRNRRRTSIGLYDFDLIEPPLSYTVSKPAETKFVPLGFEKEMTLTQILKEHPKGLEYGSIIYKHPVYPVFLDADNKVLSFPPIINSNDLGRITEETKNLLVEVTGTNHETVLNTLAMVTLSLIDRGGKAYSSVIHYPDEDTAEATPNFDTKTMRLDVAYANRVLGMELSARRIAGLLAEAGFDVDRSSRTEITVRIPCYRIDVMHQIDLVEDIAIAYGYGDMKPLWRKLATVGGLRPGQNMINIARELMVGLGFQEVLTYNLTNLDSLFTKMRCRKQDTVELANPKVQTFTCLRSWLLPSLMEFLSRNTSVEYPQRVFELGAVTLPDDKQETRTRDDERLAAITCHPTASFSEVKSFLDSWFLNMGLEWKIAEIVHSAFVDGRVGKAIVHKQDVGFLGEVHPEVLTAWKLENPAAAFELNMARILRMKR
jgi:phenylalanyl-tRNA synthetase beta chain